MTSEQTRHPADRARIRRKWMVGFALVALLALLATLTAAILFSQHQSRSHILSTFELRGTSSAKFVSEFLDQQASREQQTAAQFLSGRRPSPERFQLVVAAFGSKAAVLLDSSGRLLDVDPADPSLIGQPIAAHYAHLTAAEQGKRAVSNVVPSAARKTPVTAIAVPFSTPDGRRVFSAAYAASNSPLGRFVAHTISYRQHDVFLVDGAGRIVTASPYTGATTLAQADPQLAHAAAHVSLGAIAGAKTPTTFTNTPVPGTSWRLLIAVPNSRLFASTAGWTQVVPWIVLAIVSILGALLVTLLDRSLAARARLTLLSTTLEEVARTDPLTGLLNRRALNEHLTRASAHARRRGEDLSVMMIDLDRFKETNDRFGHEAGDQVLCGIADCMRDALRADDVYGRWGGDEFLVALPSTGREQALIAAERLRDCAHGMSLSDIGLPHGVQFSIGVATAIETTPAELVHAADVALYEAKAESHAAQRRETGASAPLES
jgi:diguanylate cyclase (GGDEF)-like protein